MKNEYVAYPTSKGKMLGPCKSLRKIQTLIREEVQQIFGEINYKTDNFDHYVIAKSFMAVHPKPKKQVTTRLKRV